MSATFTVRGHDVSQTVLAAARVSLDDALVVHAAAEGNATIFDDRDGEPACLIALGTVEGVTARDCGCGRCARPIRPAYLVLQTRTVERLPADSPADAAEVMMSAHKRDGVHAQSTAYIVRGDGSTLDADEEREVDLALDALDYDAIPLWLSWDPTEFLDLRESTRNAFVNEILGVPYLPVTL